MQSDERSSNAFKSVTEPAKLQSQGLKPNPAFMNTPPATPAQANAPLKPSISVQPSGSSVSNKPIACTRCKTKKIKCDGKTPSCSSCVRAGEQCLISDMVTGRVYPRGYISQLENRISELQSLIDTKKRELKESKSRQGSASSTSGMGSPSSSGSFPAGKRSSATSIPIQSIEEALSPSDESDGDLALARLLIQTLHLKDSEPCVSKLSLLVSNDNLQNLNTSAPAAGIPPSPMADLYQDLYIRLEHRCFPFLLQLDIHETVRRVCTHQPQAPSYQDNFRGFMIFAIGSLSHSSSDHDQTSTAFSYYNAALRYAGRIPMMAGIDAIQNLLLLCIFSLNVKITQDAWRLSRRALHVCIQEELHLARTVRLDARKSDADVTMDALKKRIFWSSYCLNRLSSNLLYNRPPSIPEAEIDVENLTEGEDEILFHTSQEHPLKRTVLRQLVALFRVSTTAFTSFKSNPPPGDSASKFAAYMQQFFEIQGQIAQSVEDFQDLPVYFTLTYKAQPMLICQWALGSFLNSIGFIPAEIRKVAISHCLTASSSITQAYGNSDNNISRLSLIVLFRTIFVTLSFLLAPHSSHMQVGESGDSNLTVENVDDDIAKSLGYILHLGRKLGHKNHYIPALALTIRYALVNESFSCQESSTVEIWGRDGQNTDEDTPMTLGLEYGSNFQYSSRHPDGSGGWDTSQPSLRSTGKQRQIDSNKSAEYFEKTYPKFAHICRTLGITETPLDLSLTDLENPAGQKPNSFKKFGLASHELDVLAEQVVWRIRVQNGGSDGGASLEAFERRLATNRPVEPFPQTGEGDPFNPVTQATVGAVGMDMAMVGAINADPSYQPISDFISGFSGPPKMDVDFSAFETNIITFT
ncbi:hypothetical protein ABW19_dt0207930 [Dactylella cylindrospora]|nr:hypothetical protein ABW19_dt0207930 [Dactylella cylindrospora]